MLISLGDFMVGGYLLVIAIYDTAIYKSTYCQVQITWMTSIQCSTIGVLSTIGSQISLFAMAGLSIIRLSGIRGALRVPGEVTLAKSLKVALGVFIIVLISAAIAITPMIDGLEDFFVNGVQFDKKLFLFRGVPKKRKILQVLNAYYGRMKDMTLSWEMTLTMVSKMFSHNEGYYDPTKTVKKQNFYGNDGVCLFKYFVRDDDPQKKYVWAILVLNFVCFLFISISYILIALASTNSSRKLANTENKRQIDQRNRKMNTRIAIIIATDFCCWIPFIVICVLHSLEVLDATPWYGIFSMIILSINSVINPFLYDSIITSKVEKFLCFVFTRITSSRIFLSRILNFAATRNQVIEMEVIEGKQERVGSAATAGSLTKTTDIEAANTNEN
jgi:hypothetical protein